MSQQQQQSSTVSPEQAYAAPTDLQGHRDEAFDTNGQIKPHWRYLLDSLQSIGEQALTDRQAKALRILRDDGATYNIYSDDPTPSRTWGLDLVPSLIDSEEWGTIEAGLLERSELFDLLLKDIYGPRTLIRTGVIPPEALFCHGGFLRACSGIEMPGEHGLILHAVDLMRDQNGDMCVLTDRTQSPSGAGYALENRTVMSRIFPSLYRDSHVHRLATFFQRLRNKLTSLATDQDQPRVVVLTPGAHNESYFEHAYISNYLGLHLVQSGDLVVRNGYVWMKSLDGLSRVDVILRRVDDWYCDPVELRSDSVLGVANLLEVVRAGRVVIANPLGSGVLENPVFLRYLPDIAKALLGRELRLKSVATHWCGEKKDLDYVMEKFDTLVIKPTYRGSGMRSVLGSQLSDEQKQTLISAIKKQPHNYVAQAQTNAGNLPTLIDGKLQPRPAILRTFSLAADESYTLMPGGLTRVGIEESAFIISNQTGSQSKDTWVIASEPERTTAQHSAEDSSTHVREIELISLPSRVVENLFWMGRYAERAEASLRILRTVFMIINGEDVISDECKRILLETVTEVSSTHPGFKSEDPSIFNTPESELLLVLKDAERMGSVRSNLNAMLFCSDQSKELLSSDTLRVINDIRDALNDMDSALASGLISAPEEALDPLVTALMALAGLTQESMMRGVGWRFMQIGRRLERGIQTTAMIQSLLVPKLTEPSQNTLIQALLLSLEGLISYRRRYRARIDVESALDLVLLDINNPRSLLFQLDELTNHINALPKLPEQSNELTAESRAILEAETKIKLTRLNQLSVHELNQRQHLNALLHTISELLGDTSNNISEKYFEHRESSRQLVRNTWDQSA